MLEGAPDGHRDELLDQADVVRADATEARLLTGEDLDSPAAAVHEATDMLRRHDLAMVAFGIGDGDVFVWPDGTRVFGHGDAKVVDTTGAGDAMSAAWSRYCSVAANHTRRRNWRWPPRPRRSSIPAAGRTSHRPDCGTSCGESTPWPANPLAEPAK